jgi:tetratricopeptide (TPR) repeat protein
VLTDPYKFPFAHDHFDAVISSSCFEHDQMFWLTFLEMVRVVKPRGYIYINAPSNGSYHRYPVDNWRFYPDAALALECWARRQGNNIKLIESFTARRKQEIWNDCVMIFSKSKNCCRNSQTKLVDKFPDSYNIRSLLSPTLENFCEETEDRILLRQKAETMQAQLADRERSLAAAERNAAIHAATAQAAQLELDAACRESARCKSALTRAQDHAAEVALATERAKIETERLQTELSSLQAMLTKERENLDVASRGRDAAAAELHKTILGRDAQAAASTRWFEAVVAITADHNPLTQASCVRNSWWRTLARRLNGKRRKPSRINLANRARDARQWELAVRYYRDALDLEPDKSAIWIQCGHALKEAGKVSEAEVAYRKALELDAENADAQARLDHVLRLQGKSRETAAAYRSALKLASALAPGPQNETVSKSEPRR